MGQGEAPTSPAPPAASTWPPREGQVLGHFKLAQQLGQGHAGVSFCAEDTKTEVLLTLKILAPEFPANNEELAQFARALKASPHLDHPHLVTMHGAGKSGSLCWIAKDYIEGESVDQPIQRLREGGKPSWVRAARVTIHLARLLQYLHRHKIVHGNITPHNVLIQAGDKQTKVTDLLLMKALQGSRLQQAFKEKKRQAELAYLAPEQTETGAVVDASTDLYALGAIAYALLTGRAPFKGSTPEALLDQVKHNPVKRPSHYQEGIPSEFEAAVLKLLAKRQEDRYSSAERLLADLEPLAEEHEIKL
jgi:serine/threonine-protein kinase